MEDKKGEAARLSTWLSVTTTPARLAALVQCMHKWDTRFIAGIWVHLPDVQARTGIAYPRDTHFLDSLPPATRALVHVNRCGTDWGPLTKWVGAASLAARSRVAGSADASDVPLPRADDVVIIVDDDTMYSPRTFPALRACLRHVRDAVGGGHAVMAGVGQRGSFWGIQHLFPTPATPPPPTLLNGMLRYVDVVEGFGGVALLADTLCMPYFEAMTKSLATLDAACFMSDDVVVSAVLHKFNIPRYALTTRLPIEQLPSGQDALSAWPNANKYQSATTSILRALA